MQTTDTRPARTGALIAAAFTLLPAMLALGASDDRCQVLVATPFLVFAVAGPTYLVGRATLTRGHAVAIRAMLVVGIAMFLIVGATWTVWGFAAHQVCR